MDIKLKVNINPIKINNSERNKIIKPKVSMRNQTFRKKDSKKIAITTLSIYQSVPLLKRYIKFLLKSFWKVVGA